MNWIKTCAIAVALGLCFFFAARFIASQKVELKPQPKRASLINVEAQFPETQSTTIKLISRGTVAAHQSSSLPFRVGGEIIAISANARVGSFVRHGEWLMKLDPLELKNEQLKAKANLAAKQLELLEEKARREQALNNWKRLKRDDKASPLLSREPQLNLKEVQLEAAQSALELSETQLRHSTLLAPYHGLVLSRSSDLAETVNPGQTVLTLLNTDKVEVRLPFQPRQLAKVEALLKLPLKVMLSSTINDELWEAHITRWDEQIDNSSRQRFAIAEVDNPYPKVGPQLRLGSFVEACLELVVPKELIAIPRSAIFNDNEIWIVNDQNRLELQGLRPFWETPQQIFLKSEDWLKHWRLVTIPLGIVHDQMEVKVVQKEQEEGS
jgi:RND family efflux transporter MFP subunit